MWMISSFVVKQVGDGFTRLEQVDVSKATGYSHAQVRTLVGVFLFSLSPPLMNLSCCLPLSFPLLNGLHSPTDLH